MLNKILAGFAAIFLIIPLSPGYSQQSTRQDTLRELMRRVEILTEEIEKAKLGKVVSSEYRSQYGMGPAASRVYQLTKPGVSLSGYGEIVFQNFSSIQDNGETSGKLNQIDFLRHITYLGFRYNDWLLFNSEIEFEHAKTSAGTEGAVSIEFGYVEARLHPSISLRAGMVLVPVGIINEMHEPPTFHGALRPEVERRIIPSTWHSNGFGLVGQTHQGFGYKLYIVESLYAARFSSNGIRNGRQNGSKAFAEDFALTGRLNYSGRSGLNIGGSFYVGNSGQNLVDTASKTINVTLSLISMHLIFARRGFELRGFYAQSHLSDVARLNTALGLTGNHSIGEKQSGFYLTTTYDFLPLFIKNTSHYLAPFIQFEKFNTQAAVPSGFSKNPARDRTNVTFGLTYKPHPNVAFKVDFINRENEANTAVNQFNLAVTYLF
ncbi:MAG: hypothetical protein ACE5HX_10290 [bacterium]